MKQKIKILKDIFLFTFLIPLILSSCRQDELNQTELEKNKITSSFGIFESKNNKSTFADDSGHAYTHSWNIGSISPTQLQLIIAQAHLYSTYNYDLGFSNCADFALSAISLAGVNINNNGIDTPNTVADLIGGTAINGTAPATNRTCSN